VSRSSKAAAIATIATTGLLIAIIHYGRTARVERNLEVLPKTARGVLRFDSSRVTTSQSARALFRWLAPEARLTEIEALCDLDPATAFADVIVWVGGPEGEPFQSIGLLLRGHTVDSEALARCYRRVVEARGGSIRRATSASRPLLISGDGRSALVQVDSKTVVTGSAETVDEFLAVADGMTASLLEEARFRKLWRRLATGAAIAGAFVAPPRWQSAIERLGTIGNGASALTGIESIGFTTKAGTPTGVMLVFDVVDAETARRDAALMDVWVRSPPEELAPEWIAMTRGAHIEVTDRSIFVTLDVSTLPKRSL
jgi:hypothetical protein